MNKKCWKVWDVGWMTLLLLTFTGLAWTQTPDVHKVADSVDRHYNSLGSLETNFTESFRGAGMSRTEDGVMYLKKPGKMRWDYKTPREKVFVTDGKTAWFYVPGERQARRTAVKNLDDFRSPLRYLLGKTKLEKEFDGLSIVTADKPMEPGNVILRGVPKGMEDRVQESRLEVAPDGRIVRISIEQLDGTLTEFRFRDPKQNVQLSDQMFKFSPPAGVEVMQANELEP
jgi:outer membrane lipoprotein carrier protein